MIWLFLIFFILFPKISYAATTVTLNSVPPAITIGESFPISFTLSTSSTSSSFHYKVVGTGVTLTTVPDSGCSGSYNSCPEISIGESGTVNGTAYAKITVITGPISVLIEVAESLSHATTSSQPQIIPAYIIPAPSETPTPISTYIPTNTPVPPTNTPNSTNTPIPTLIPSLTPTKIPTSTPFSADNPIPSNDPLPTDDPNAQILGIADSITPIPTQKPKSSRLISPNLIPTIFIVLGASLLLIPLIISKIKFRRR